MRMRAFSFARQEARTMNRLLALALFSAAALLGSGEGHAADQTLVINNGIKVTDDDFLAYMERVPKEMRLEAMADGERNNKVVDLIFTNRMLAVEARKAGLDKDPVMARRIEQAVEAFLALQYQATLARDVKFPDLEARAYELYLANPKRWTEPDRVELQHILVGLNGRTRELALARANEIRRKALAGEDFLKLAETSSDDPAFKRNGGRLGFVAAPDLDHRLALVAFRMKADGEVSEPIETTYGYHLIKRTGFKPSYKRKYEDVKSVIIEEQQAKLRDDAPVVALDRIRRSPETHWNAKAIAALRTEIPREEVERRQREELQKMDRLKADVPLRPSEDLGVAGPQRKN
jgi:peptidyl-prolyl cis-trans isomerase C